jgi:hypothetical protein
LGIFIYKTGVRNIKDPANLTNGNLFQAFVFGNGEKNGPVTSYSDINIGGIKQQGFTVRATGNIDHGSSIFFIMTDNATGKNLFAMQIAIQ